jgi:hypothetical protein
MFRADGTIDPSFDGNATLLVPQGPSSVNAFAELTRSQNKMLVMASGVYGKAYADQFNLDGSLDASFEAGGRLIFWGL